MGLQNYVSVVWFYVIGLLMYFSKLYRNKWESATYLLIDTLKISCVYFFIELSTCLFVCLPVCLFCIQRYAHFTFIVQKQRQLKNFHSINLKTYSKESSILLFQALARMPAIFVALLLDKYLILAVYANRQLPFHIFS